jgi:copper chaperone
MKRVHFEVNGMTCGHCVSAVKEAASSVEGVTVESVAIGSVLISLDDTRATVGDVVDAIADAGYEAAEAAA